LGFQRVGSKKPQGSALRNFLREQRRAESEINR
jgi:hypothetical protein